jgi:hypothetical protein
MLVAFVATIAVVPALIPASASVIVRVGLPAIAVAIVGTEAYIRAIPSRSRRAFEAFSWLGEWEIANVRAVTGGGVPTAKSGAVRWLASRPERLEEAAFRVEVLLFAERIDEARALLDRVPADTGYARFVLAALRDLVDWRAGGDGDLAGMEATAAELLPPDGDDRLRAEVVIATARVRRRMADGRATAGDAVEPLLEVRERLGDRADGQVGRALRPRLWPMLLVMSLLFEVALESLGSVGNPF